MANVTVTLKTKFYWYTKPVLALCYIYWRLFGGSEKPACPRWAFKVEVA